MDLELLGDLPLTTQEYLREPLLGVELINLERHVDDSGSFTELGRFTGVRALTFTLEPRPGWNPFRLAQINYSEVEPGGIKALHLHRRQTDLWFVPASDKMLVVLYDCREDGTVNGAHRVRRLVLGDGRSALLRIPPGVAHGCKNLRPTLGHLIYLVDQIFDPYPDRCDEHRLPWDILGADIWEVRRE